MGFRTWFGCGLLAAGFLISVPALAAAANAVAALPIFNTDFHGARYSTCTVDPMTQDLRIYWDDGNGNVLGNFTTLQKKVAAGGDKLIFAANAGMFDPSAKPVGLLVQDGTEKSPLNLNDGTGNFYMKPNGVFLLHGMHRASVIESSAYSSLRDAAMWATQSGPLLVHGGDINPDFMPDSKNRKIRSGVGVTAKGDVIFALSKEPVTFYEFAELFLSKLHCPNALYLDGEISDFWTPGMMEKDCQHHFGPMIAVVSSGAGVLIADPNRSSSATIP